MKFAFLFVSIACALALTSLSLIIATGKIPFAKAEEDVVPATQTKKPLTVFSGQQEVIDVMIKDLKSKQELYEKKMADITAKEENLRQQEKIINSLKIEMGKLQSKFDTLVVELELSESANFKHLADVYSKMAPSSAASLLQQMEQERAAIILNMIGERQAAGIFDAAVAAGEKGIKAAADWSDIIRRIKKKKKKG